MEVCVVIPTYRPDKKLKLSVERLLEQTIRPDSILLINSCNRGSEEKIPLVIRELMDRHNSDVLQCINISVEDFDHGGTRHMAMGMCESKYVLFMSQDAIPYDRQLIEHMRDSLEKDSMASMVYARQVGDKDCPIIEWCTRMFNYPEGCLTKSKADINTMGIKAIFASDVCAMYRRTDYYALGGFPLRAILAEEQIYANKVIEHGKHVIYNGDAKVIHYHNYTVGQQFRRNFDIGVSHIEHNEVFGKFPPVPEGVRMVRRVARYLLKNGYFYMLPQLMVHSAGKYLGYRMGRLYKRLPLKLRVKCCMNKRYFLK